MDGTWRMIAAALVAAALAGAGAWRLSEEETRRDSAAATAIVMAAAQSRIASAEAETAQLRTANAAAEARLAGASERTRRGWCMARFERESREALEARVAAGGAAEAPKVDRRTFVDACLVERSAQSATGAGAEQTAW